jgi:AcrR family transcriptional regulator
MSPTQAERREATTTALVAAGRELFAADGYAATSLDAVVAKAGVTKGALYHHFAGKKELFEAVFAAEQQRLLETVTAAYGEEDDAWQAFEAGCRAFLEICLEPEMQRIFLLDAHGALGWEKVRELEHSSLDAMEAAIQLAVDQGRIEPRDPEPLANMLFGLLCETSMVVARAPDQDRAQKDAVAELHRIFRSLAG